jgi:hypothetical protein
MFIKCPQLLLICFSSLQADEAENFEVVYVRPNSDDMERLTVQKIAYSVQQISSDVQEN